MPTPGTPQDRKPKKTTAAKKAAASQNVQRVAVAAAMHSAATTPDPAGGTADPYAPTAWGQTGGLEDVVCPSGQRALVRRPGIQGLILAGALEEMDSLSAVVDQKHIKRVKGQEEIDVESLVKDPKEIMRVINIADRIVLHCVVKPVLHSVPENDEDREPGVIYVDMVDLDDRLFLMNYAVGGTRDAERFRDERDATVGSLGDGSEVLVSAE